MNIDQAFPSDFLRASDLEDGNLTLVISGVKVETIGQGAQQDTKPVLSFEGNDKRLVLNKTNANTIKKLYGPETDQWVGKAVTLMAREVEFQGETVMAVRVSLQKPAMVTKGGKKVADDVPF